MKPFADCRLYAFVDLAYLRGRDPAAIAAGLCDGGADIIQLRAKGLLKSEVAGIATQLLPVTTSAAVWLVLNDYPDVALEVGVPACHLGQEDFFDAGFSKVTSVTGGRDLRIGLSTHGPDQANRAVAAGPDYIAIGPVFPTGTKPSAKPVTLEYVRWAAANITIPWFAIGGITLQNLPEVLGAGAKRICVVSAILNASNVAAACAKFKERLMSQPL